MQEEFERAKHKQQRIEDGTKSALNRIMQIRQLTVFQVVAAGLFSSSRLVS